MMNEPKKRGQSRIYRICAWLIVPGEVLVLILSFYLMRAVMSVVFTEEQRYSDIAGRTDPLEFYYWFIFAFCVFTFHFLFYILIKKFEKIIINRDLLILLTIITAIFIPSLFTHQNGAGQASLGTGLLLLYLFTLIIFAVSTIAMRLSDKSRLKRDCVKHAVSFVCAFVFGGGLLRIIWLIFTGFNSH